MPTQPYDASMTAADGHWSTGEASLEQAIERDGGRGWIVAVTTSSERSLRLQTDSREEELAFLRRAWEICVRTLGEEATGRHVTWRFFMFHLADEQALPRISRLFGALVSDQQLNAVPWHLAASPLARHDPWYQLPEWHTDFVRVRETPRDRVEAQVSDHRDDDPRSWVVIV